MDNHIIWAWTISRYKRIYLHIYIYELGPQSVFACQLLGLQCTAWAIWRDIADVCIPGRSICTCSLCRLRLAGGRWCMFWGQILRESEFLHTAWGDSLSVRDRFRSFWRLTVCCSFRRWVGVRICRFPAVTRHTSLMWLNSIQIYLYIYIDILVCVAVM